MKHKKIIGSIGAIALLGTSTVMAAKAYDSVLYFAVTVGDKPVKAYETSDTSKFKLYIESDKIISIKEMTMDGWCRVEVDGQECWVFREDIQNIEYLKGHEYYMVNEEPINVYDGIHKTDKIVKSIKNGEKIIAHGEDVYLFDGEGNIEDVFLRVESEDEESTFNYVHKKYFETKKVNEYVGMIKEDAKLYGAPKENAVSKGDVTKGTTVKVISSVDGYSKIKHNSDIYYIKHDLVEPFESKYMYLDTEKATKVAVYENPTDTSKRLGYIYSDLARLVTNIVGEYAEINYSGGIGYVKYDLLRNSRVTETKYVANDVEVKEKSSGNKVIGKLKQGDKVKVLGYYKNTLARVELGDIKGYVSVDVLSDIKPKYMYLDTSKSTKVAVYEKATDTSKRLGYIYSDLARFVTKIIDGYAEINYSGGIGYVKYDLLRSDRVTENKYLTKNVDVKEKSSGSKVIGKLKQGDKVKVLGYYKNTLARVELGDIKGYVSVDVLSDIKPKYMYLDTSKSTKVAVYEKATDTSKRLGYIYSDLARFVTKIIDGYAEINYSGGVGYVKYDLLRNDRVTEIMYLKDTVNLTEKSTNSVIVGSLSKGQEVVVLGYYKDTLARIQCGDIKGYVKKELLSDTELMYLDALKNEDININTRYSVQDKVSVYSDASLKECIGVLAKGDKIEFIKDINTSVAQYKINANLKAYINKVDVTHRNPIAKNTTSIVTKKIDKTHGEYVDSQVGKPYVTLSDVKYYSNPKNYSLSNNNEKYQFLKLDTFKNINVYELNEYLNNLKVQNGKTAIFKNQAQAFIDAAKKNNIDPIYLVAHTMLETGYGSSTLAQGVVVTKDAAGNEIEPTKVHNLFGIGAVDSDAVGQGSKTAYALGWTDIPKAIDGAAKWIATGVKADASVGLKESKGYIHSERFTEQYNLYSMRWDYVHGWHQYATDPQWALKISKLMNTLSYLYEGANLVFENIEYKASPKVNEVEDEVMEVSKKSQLRSGPSDKYRVLSEVEQGQTVTVKAYVDSYAYIEYAGKEFYIIKNNLKKVQVPTDIKDEVETEVIAEVSTDVNGEVSVEKEEVLEEVENSENINL